jgi:hypothetical protein
MKGKRRKRKRSFRSLRRKLPFGWSGAAKPDNFKCKSGYPASTWSSSVEDRSKKASCHSFKRLIINSHSHEPDSKNIGNDAAGLFKRTNSQTSGHRP